MFRKITGYLKRKVLAASVAVSVAVMTAVPALASSPPAFANSDGVIDSAAFDPLVTGITGNIGVVMPKVMIILALLIGLGVAIALFKKNATPGK